MAIASSDRKAALSGQTPRRTECSETGKNINKHKLNKFDKHNKSDPTSSANASHKNGKRDLNFIQINTCKGKQATNDLVIFAKNYTSLIMLVQEPYVNGKNIIPKPSGDIGVIVDTTVDLDTRPRACIYHHRSLIISCGEWTHCPVETARPYRPTLITYQRLLSRVTWTDLKKTVRLTRSRKW